MSTKVVDKAVAYVIREHQGQTQVLVFDHEKKWSSAGTQVPAGTVDPGEDPQVAVIREVEEETGISDVELVKKIDEYEFFNQYQSQQQRRHVFWLRPTRDLPDTWDHRVSGGGIDDGMMFHCYWLSLFEATEKLVAGLGNSLNKIEHDTRAPVPRSKH